MDCAINICNKTFTMICPCCGKEIIVVIDDIQNFSNENELKKISKNLDIEFGEQRGGEIKNE